MNVRLKLVSSTSVQVSWDGIGLPEIRSYVVYYSRVGGDEGEGMLSTFPDSVTVGGLTSGSIYVFQVAAVANVGNGDMLMGERSAGARILVTTAEVLTQGVYSYRYS